MKNLMLKKILASLTAICLLFGMLPFTAFAVEDEAEPESATRIITGEKADVSRPDRGGSAVQSAEVGRFEYYEPDETVTVIVMLDAPAAANYYNPTMPISVGGGYSADSMSAGKKLSAFLSSDEALRVSEQNKAQQLELASKISSLSLGGSETAAISTFSMPVNNVELVAQFTGIINAMSVKMPYGLLEQVKKLDGVKTAYVEKTYSIPKDEELEPLVGGIEKYGYAQAGVNGLWNEGYTGQGMVVAVLDTSLDIFYGSWYDYAQGDNVTGVRGSHEAFRDDSFLSDNPSEFVSYNQNSIAKRVSSLGELLASETLAPGSGRSWYKTLKVPYAADYSHMADDGRIDNNVRSAETHGTHVSGTILGYAETDDGAVKFSGVAPDAQLLFMKVFGDDGTMTSSTPLLAALNDAAYLGADVVNLSLGSDNGFSQEDTAYSVFFDMLEEFGVIASVSNGNAGNSQQLNGYTEGLAYAENPDVTMTSSPAIYDNALAVASVNTEVYGATFLKWSDGETEHKIRYVDTGTSTGGSSYIKSYLFGEVNPNDTLEGNNRVYDCGLGYQTDYEKYDWVREEHLPPTYQPSINGEDSGFALVQRGTLDFWEKVANAMNCNYGSNQVAEYDLSTYTYFPTQGLRGIIVYNTEPGYISMDLSELTRPNTNYPAIFISQADGEEMAAAIAAGKPVTITFVNTEEEAAEWPVTPEDADQPGQMSSFSSWGGGPGLELKPDITAPGGMVYSTVPDATYDTSYKYGTYDDYNGSYEYMSGTSMAAPHISGIAALVSQALSESGNAFYRDRTVAQRAKLVEHLMVSTAVPLKDDVTGGYVSPRIQGAGLVNAGAAIKTPVFIDVEGENVGKLELLDDADWSGSFDFSFDVVNAAETAHTYTAELVVMTPDITEVNGKTAYAEHDRVLYRKSLGSVEVTPTVSSGNVGGATVSGTVEYDAAAIKAVSPNGTYIEGYIILTPVGEELPTVGVPFMGFAGDWTAAPAFDNIQWYEVSDGEGNYNEKLDDTVFIEPEVYGLFYGMAGTFTQYDSIPALLGANPFDVDIAQMYNDGPYYQGNFTISPDGDGYLDGINYFEIYQLRDAKVLMFEVSDKNTGDVYFSTYITDFPRTPFSYDEQYNVYVPYPFSLQLMNMGFAYSGENVLDYETGEYEILPDGTQLEFKIAAFGEGDYYYYIDEASGATIVNADNIYIDDPSTWPTFNGHKMDMTGDIISFDLLVDTSDPVLVANAASLTEQEDGTYLFECTFDDGVGSIASIEVDPYVTYTVKEEYVESAIASGRNLVEHYMGDPIDSQLFYDEDLHTYTYTCVLPNPETYYEEGPYGMYDVTWDDGTFYVFCGDYGAHDAAYVFQINDKVAAEGELNAVWEYGDFYVGDAASVTVIDNTGVDGDITYTSSDETVATVDETGYITAVGEGTAVITLEKAGKTATVVITVKARASEITDFSFSIENYKTLIPNQSIDIRIEDIVPVDFNGANAPVITECVWEITDPNWQYYDDGGDPFTLTVNDIPTRAYYQKEATVSLSTDALSIYAPGTTGAATLTVTLNGCTKTTQIFYAIPDAEDYLISADYTQGMTKYITLGESVDAAAQYYNNMLHQLPKNQVRIKVCTTEGFTWDELNWSGTVSTEDSVGLYIVPSTGEAGSAYEGYIVAMPGYDLPKEEDIHVGVYYESGSYSPKINGSYKQWTYDESTGRFWVDYLPYSSDSMLIITADGVSNSESQGTTPPPGIVDPSEGEGSEVDSLNGPFVWSVAAADGTPLANYGTLVENSDSRNSVTFTPNAPGVYLLTATNKAGTMSVTWTVVVYKPATDGSITLVPDTTGFESIENVSYSLVLTEGSDPSQLVLKAYDGSGNEIPLPDDLIWSSSDTSVVTVDQNGVVTAVDEGIATVTVRSASNLSVTAHFVIQVVNKPAHVHRLLWTYNESSHWQVCIDGDYVGQAFRHEFSGSVCRVCGYIAPYAQPTPLPAVADSVNIEFTVVDENGSPVPYAAVSLSSSVGAAVTGPDGKAVFYGVGFGYRSVTVGSLTESFELVLGSEFGMNGSVITASSGDTISLTLVYGGGMLELGASEKLDDEETTNVDVPTEGKHNLSVTEG